MIDSDFDWSTGAYEQVFTAHPEWVGKVIADLNFELPALAHGAGARIRSCYEYQPFLEQFLEDLPVLTRAYPEDASVVSPIETWSDDFSMAIAGIPSTVNDFSAGPFMQNYYHSQYDNQDVYQEAVYQFHHECYLKLVMAFDRLVLPPMNFSNTIKAVISGIHENALSFASEEQDSLTARLEKVQELCSQIYTHICQINQKYAELTALKERTAFRKSQETNAAALLKIFRKTQDYLVRLNWQDEVIFPQESASILQFCVTFYSFSVCFCHRNTFFMIFMTSLTQKPAEMESQSDGHPEHISHFP